MKNYLAAHGRALALAGVLVPLLALFVYVGLRSGLMASVAVTVAAVESRSITPALFGIGTIEARYTNKIGPTLAGRVKRLDVNVGDRVKAGQLLGEMDPIDLDDRIRSQEASLRRAEAALREAGARQVYAQTQAQRYEQLLALRSTSEEITATKRQELQIANAAQSAAREDLVRARSDRQALVAQRGNLRLIAPVDGLVAVRSADPGTTVVAGQAVVEVIDPKSLWINVRFDQVSATGLAAGLPARIMLRSRNGLTLAGHLLWLEPMADAVTEETLAKVVFDSLPSPLPPVGELAEVTIALPALAARPVIPNAAVQRVDGRLGVWQMVDGNPRFTPVKLGAGNLEGYMQVNEGLKEGDRVIVYSEKRLTTHSRIKVVEHIRGAQQ